MSALPGYLLPTGIFIIIVAVLLAAVALISSFFSKKTRQKLTTDSILHTYLNFMAIITGYIAVVGMILALAAVISLPVSYKFSYRLERPMQNIVDEGGIAEPQLPESLTPSQQPESSPQPSEPFLSSKLQLSECYTGELQLIDGEEYCVATGQRTSDIITGITLTLSLAFLFVIHRLAASWLQARNPFPLVRRIYIFISLSLYGILGVIAIPTAIYETIRYFLITSSNLEGYNAPLPGPNLAAAIIITPIWLYFLLIAFRLNSNSQTEGDTEAASIMMSDSDL